MDIEAPHGPIETWKDFFIHLCIITLGLLIALGLEGTVAHFHERSLVKEARANIRTEVVDNQKSIEASMKATSQEKENMQNLLDYLELMKKNPAAHGSAEINFHMTNLNRASWNTAAATGAFGFMPYRDVKRYEDIYDSQNEFLLSQQQAMNDWAGVYGAFLQLMRQDQKAKPTDAGTAQINAVEEKTQTYIGRLMGVESSAESLDQQYTNFLKSN